MTASLDRFSNRIAAAEANVCLELATSAEIQADEDHVELVVSTLIDNGLRYGCCNANAQLTIGLRAASGSCLFFVRDNGPGIHSSGLKRLFRPFERLHDGSQGISSSLAATRKIARLYGGEAWAESTPGGGTTVNVRFPYASN